jgi:hypothetical protein
MNTQARCTLTGMRFAVGAAAVILLPFSAGVASAAVETPTFSASGAFNIVISGVKSDDNCTVLFGKGADGSTGWNPPGDTIGTNDDGAGNSKLTDFPALSNGYHEVKVHCQDKNGKQLWDDYVFGWNDNKVVTQLSGPGTVNPPAVPAAATPTPLNGTYQFDDGKRLETWTITGSHIHSDNGWDAEAQWKNARPTTPNNPLWLWIFTLPKGQGYYCPNADVVPYSFDPVTPVGAGVGGSIGGTPGCPRVNYTLTKQQ